MKNELHNQKASGGVGCLGTFLIVLIGVPLLLYFTGNMTSTPGSKDTRRAPASAGQSSAAPAAVVVFPTDLGQIIAKYGAADSDDSTQFDKPRPFIVTRILEYKNEHVRLAFVPDVPNGKVPPPYKKWKLVGCIDTLKEVKITEAEAATRLESRAKKGDQPDSSQAAHPQALKDKDDGQKPRQATPAQLPKVNDNEQKPSQAAHPQVPKDKEPGTKQSSSTERSTKDDDSEVNEKAAANKLKLAKQLLGKNKEAAKQRLESIVKEFPDTKAGSEASELLKEP